MSKASYSPGKILSIALDKYLEDEEITSVLKDNEKLELKMKAIAFSLKTITSYYGRQIEAKIEKDVVVFSFSGMEIYRLSNEQIKHINVPLLNQRIDEVSVDVGERLWINLFFHYGNILGVLERMGVDSQSETDKTIQTTLAI